MEAGTELSQRASMPGGRILLVEDDEDLRAICGDALQALGHSVESARNGYEAIGKLKGETYDVVLSDLSMPGVDGLEFLRRVRERDSDLPVVLMTGGPALESAMRALEYGAFRYVTKPVDLDALDEIIGRAIRSHRLSRLKRHALEIVESSLDPCDEAALQRHFDLAMQTLWVAYQPIISWSQKRPYGYEALVRAGEPTLSKPDSLFACGTRLGRVHEIGRAVRRQAALAVQELPADQLLFVNVHALELEDDDLLDPAAPLSQVAKRIVLEVTERASLDGREDVAERIARLREMGFRIAIDDVGAGYAGLAAVANLEPDIIKLDRSLVCSLHTQPTKQRLIQALIELARDLHMRVVSEGIELPEERDALLALGCDLLQGFLFARPGKGFGTPSW